MRTHTTIHALIKKCTLVLVIFCLTSCKKTEEPQSTDTPTTQASSSTTKKYRTLSDAVIVGDIAAVQDLLNQGADVHTITMQEGWTPLHYAAHQGSLEMVELLCRHGADVNEISKTPDDSNYIDTSISPLYAAVMGGNIPVVHYLVAHGAETKTFDNMGTTLLHLSVEAQNVPLTTYLLSLGTPVTDCINYRTAHRYDAETPLSIASRNKNKELMQLLIAHGANSNEERSDGTTVLTDAVCNGDLPFVEYLLHHGADVSLCDEGGRTALHYAAQCGNVRIAQLLLEHGAYIDENAAGASGSVCFCGSPLMVATQAGHIDMVTFLLLKGADLNVRDEIMEESALDIAKKKDNTQLVELLTSAAQNNYAQVA